MAKKSTYNVTVEIERLQVDVEVKAESLEDAIQQGRAMKIEEVLAAYDSLVDFEGPRVTGVWS